MTTPRSPSDSTQARATPSVLPVLALREAVVFPLTIAPVFLDKERSRSVVEELARGDGLVALVGQREGDSRPPSPEDLVCVRHRRSVPRGRGGA